MTEEKLMKILESGDAKKCMRFFKGMPESERRKLAPCCLRRMKSLDRIVQLQENVYAVNPERKIMAVALPNVCTAAELKRFGVWGMPDEDTMFAILNERRPDWIDSWAKTNASHWSLVHRLVQAKLCAKPDVPEYYVAMISALGGWRRDDVADLSKELLKDPELLEHDVWKLFEYDGNSQQSLSLCDGWRDKSSWGLTLCKLAQSGHISRDRLIDNTLDALQRDFNHFRAKWFQRMHDALELNEQERSDRRDRYLSLLRCSAAPVVSWSFKEVERLHKTSPYDPKTLVTGITPVLQSRQKGIVKRALKLLERLSTAAPKIGKLVAQTSLVALAHEDTEVQSQAFGLIEKLGNPNERKLAAAVDEHLPLVAASIKPRIGGWLEGDAGAAKKKKTRPKPNSPKIDTRLPKSLDPNLTKLAGLTALVEAMEKGHPSIPATSFHGMDIPRLSSESRIEPITQLDDLIDLCARVIEDSSQTDENEQVLDGISRLCDQRPDDFAERTGPLKKRCVTLLKRSAPPFSTFDPTADLCSLIHAWITGEVLEGCVQKKSGRSSLVFDFGPRERSYILPEQRSPMALLARRTRNIAVRASKQSAAPLLSAPTHAGAWICPHRLVERVNDWKAAEPDIDDVCLSLLRLAPDNRAAALKRLGTTTGQWKQAIKYALGGKRVKIGNSAPLWFAAARARAPWRDDPLVLRSFKGREPDGAVAAKIEYTFKSEKRGTTSYSLLELVSTPAPTERPVSIGGCFVLGMTDKVNPISAHSPGTTRWQATIWPQARESYFACGTRALHHNLDWWEAEWCNKEFLVPLLDPDTPLHEMGSLLLCLGLSAKEPGEHGLAIDIAINAIDDGRIGSDSIGPVLARLISADAKPSRLAKALGEVARASELHAVVIQHSLQSALRQSDGPPPKDLSKLLELLKELSIELGLAIADQECRDFLDRFEGSGKAAKLAKQLLQLQPSDGHSIARAGQLAIQNRLDRVQRWQKGS